MRVIAFAGAKGSGKNTAADMVGHLLHARPDGQVRRPLELIAFADPMREALAALVPRAVVGEQKNEPCPLLGGATGRDLLIALGEGVRAVHANFWAEHLARRLDNIDATASPRWSVVVAVTDLRRANELDALEAWERGSPDRHLARVWIERPGHSADEVLEASVRERCAVISNAGTPADLWIRCAALAAWARGERVTVPFDDAPREVLA